MTTLTPDEITLGEIWNAMSQAQRKFLFVGYNSLDSEDRITEERTLLFSTATSIALKPYIEMRPGKFNRTLWYMRPSGKVLVEFAMRIGATPKSLIYLRLKRGERGANIGLMVLLNGMPEIEAFKEAGWEVIDPQQYRNAYHTIDDYYYSIALPKAAAPQE